ncbi:MBL fold metallo-hydrolase [Rhodococcus spelaei]|uniref:MBL fold metallo-hydrolase n=1 Tax=Rhodococcus spelaei TaxID=2546320 RepID=A0A541BPH2_9NOCA|nr:MBL fold metallo-hydrolase [Rhodococcus spelaei]TQF74227.1 MBL fold metallo-hydrolase [Rhodococcus spelaei]
MSPRIPLRRPSVAGYDTLPAAEGSIGSSVRGTFLGTSSVLIRDARTALLVDGFVTRPGFVRLVLGKIGPDAALIDECLGRAGIDALDAVLCAHSHYDHALDAPVIAQKFDAPVIGSGSTANIARGYGLPDRLIRAVEGEAELRFGDFGVTFVAGLHSPGDVAPGTVDSPLVPPARARQWRTGEAYSIFFRHPRGSVLVHASANHVPGRLDGHHADVVYLGVGTLGRQSARFRSDYWHEVVRATGARTVIPVHWDDFTRPLSRPLRPLPYPVDDLAAAMEFLLEQGRRDGVRVLMPEPWTAVELLSGR